MGILRFTVLSLLWSSVGLGDMEKTVVDFSSFRSAFIDNLYSQIELKHYTDAKMGEDGRFSYEPQAQGRYVLGTVLWKDRLNVSATLGVVRKPGDTLLKPRRSNLYYELSLMDYAGFRLDHYTSFWLPQRGKDHGTIGDVGLSGGYSVGSDLAWWLNGDVSGTLTSRPKKRAATSLQAVDSNEERETLTQKQADIQGRLSSGVSYKVLDQVELGFEGIYDREFTPRLQALSFGKKDENLYEVVEKTMSRVWLSYAARDDIQLRARLYQYFEKRFEAKAEGVQMIAEFSVVAQMI
ncbi:MAG: hypothetical protein AB8C84_10105 [Oligoflexales bacterium]